MTVYYEVIIPTIRKSVVDDIFEIVRDCMKFSIHEDLVGDSNDCFCNGYIVEVNNLKEVRRVITLCKNWNLQFLVKRIDYSYIEVTK